MLQSKATLTKEAHVQMQLVTTLVLLISLVAPSTAQDRSPRKQSKAPAATIEVGKPAPAFRLNDHLGKMAKVGGVSKNWTVIAFYPKAMTPG